MRSSKWFALVILAFISALFTAFSIYMLGMSIVGSLILILLMGVFFVLTSSPRITRRIRLVLSNGNLTFAKFIVSIPYSPTFYGKTLEFHTNTLRIDRNKGLYLDDPELASLHAEIFYRQNRFFIVNLNNDVMMWVNGIPVLPIPQQVISLRGNEQIQLGSTILDLNLSYDSVNHIRTLSLEITSRGTINEFSFSGRTVTELTQVHFSGYCPEIVHPNQEYGLFIYAHVDMPETRQFLERDIEKFTEELGGYIPQPVQASKSVFLLERVLITVVPECDELIFSPSSLQKPWNGERVKFAFDFTPDTELIGERLFVRASMQVAGIEIANLKWLVEVKAREHLPPMPSQSAQDVSAMHLTAMSMSPKPSPMPENPLAAAKAKLQHTRAYQKIFVSYSRQDKDVVQAYRFAQIAIGNEVFVDTYSIPPGASWEAQLAEAIDKADIFQLFWSEHSAASENVRNEWSYALDYKCPDTKCVDFIRPVFWVEPLPVPPPPELAHLNFRHVSLSTSPSATSQPTPKTGADNEPPG